MSKMLAILDLFSVGEPVITAEEIISRLGYSRPQGYRYIKELYEAGLLRRFSGAYALGPRVIELDFTIRQSDPLLQASEPVMRDLRDRTGCDVLLASMFGDRVVAIHHERGTDTATVSFSRGRPMPLFRGAGSKVILAFLPPRKQKEIVDRYVNKVEDSTLGREWEEIRASLKKIRRAGFAVSVGELDPANAAIAVPIFYEESAPPASLVLVLSGSRYATSDRNAIAQIGENAAATITASLKERQAQSRTLAIA